MNLNRRDALKLATGFAIAGWRRSSAESAEAPAAGASSAGLNVVVFRQGYYDVSAPDYGWAFRGEVGSRIENVQSLSGADPLGAWQEIAFDHGTDRSSAIRLYEDRQIVLFSTEYAQDSVNSDPFPRFIRYPQDLFTFSYDGLWSSRFGRLGSNSPWLFFDAQANAFLLSPAANFMTAVSRFADDGAIEAAIDARIDALPAGFSHRTVLAFGHGINDAFNTWGRALTDLSGKNRPASDATTLLSKLSYWTDAAAAYYYHPQDPTQYIPVLLQLAPQFKQQSVPIASMELDSWHYPKGSPASWVNNGSGMSTFEADPSIFPNGLAAFQQTLGLPLIAHARWIDAKSPMRAKYEISGNAPIDPRYWRDYAKHMLATGIEVLEQDWLSGPAVTAFNLSDPQTFLDNMASELASAGRTIVYCMPLATHLMQSSKYDNVISARVSNDGFRRPRWDELLFDSRLASAVGLWPFADAFLSDSVRDVLLATLTAGPIGSGDALGAMNGPNLRQAVRADGVIVKPDVPILPTDATYVAVVQSDVAPIVATTYTDHGGLRIVYVLAYDRTDGASSPVSLPLDSIGINGPAYAFDYFQKTGVALEQGAPLTATVDYNGSYFIVAPIGLSGIAFLGDAGKFAAAGRKRIEQLSDDGVVRAVVRFAEGETQVVLRYYSASPVIASATEGDVGRPALEHRHRYTLVVRPGASGAAVVTLQPESGRRGVLPR